MTLLIAQILFTLATLSSAETLSLYAGFPTDPDPIANASCCVPIGTLSFTVLRQTTISNLLFDVVDIQAAQWEGLDCVPNNITGSSIVEGLSQNNTLPLLNGNTIRNLYIKFTRYCSIALYESSSDPLDFGEVDVIAPDVFNGLSILACLWLFYRYYKTPSKPLSLHLIFILSVADCLYHILYLIGDLIPSQDSLQDIEDASSFDPLLYGNVFMQYFSICWSTTMSIIFTKALSNNTSIRPPTLKTWVLWLLPSFIFSACFVVVAWQFIYPNEVERGVQFVGWSFGIFVLPIAVTIVCYIRTVKVLRRHPVGFRNKDHALFLYPSVQLIILITGPIPEILMLYTTLSLNTKLLLFDLLNPIQNLVGLANGAIYLIQKRRKPVVSNPPDEDSSNEPWMKENKSSIELRRET